MITEKKCANKEVFIEKFVAKSENHTTCHKQKIFYISVKKILSCFGKSTKVFVKLQCSRHILFYTIKTHFFASAIISMESNYQLRYVARFLIY